MPRFTPAAKNKLSRPRERFRRASVGFNLLTFIRTRHTCVFGEAQLTSKRLFGSPSSNPRTGDRL